MTAECSTSGVWDATLSTWKDQKDEMKIKLNNCNRPLPRQIPVYAGADSSLLNYKVESDDYYGIDGMGDIITEHDKDLGKLEAERAVPALIRLVEEHKGGCLLYCDRF